MKKNGEKEKKIGSRLQSSKKKQRPPDILRSIKSTNKLSAHNSSSRSSCRGMVKLKDISLTPGLPRAIGRLHMSSAKREKESSNGTTSTQGQMRMIKEIVPMDPDEEYGDGPNMEIKLQKTSSEYHNQRPPNLGHSHQRSISEQLKQRKMDIGTDTKKQDKPVFKIEAHVTEPEKSLQDTIELKYLEYQKGLRLATGNPDAYEIQYFCYKKLINKETQKFKFRQTFFQKLPSKSTTIQQIIQQSPIKILSDKRLAEDSAGSNSFFVSSDQRKAEDETNYEEAKDSPLKTMNITFQNSRSSTGMGTNSTQNAIIANLNQMCYQNMKMCTNLPGFYRSLINKIKDESSGQLIFEHFEVDQIVEAAMDEKIPLITAKRWAITDKKKAVVYQGKSQDEQVEIASMTKICTAYTVCRILEELDLGGIEKAKNIYLRVSRKAAFMGGTSAYVQTDNRLSLYDCMCALLLPSGNDAAIVLATEFGRWLFMIGDKQKNSKVPILGMKGKINTFSNKQSDVDHMINQAFKFPNKGHEDYIEAFINEMNKQSQKLRLKKCSFINPHGLQQKANHASASDVVCLMNYAMKYDIISEITNKSSHQCIVYSFDLLPRKFIWENTNKLLNEFFIGSKTGITPGAGPCLVTQFQYGAYSSQGCLIDSKTQDIRWKEMSTILLWQFDKFLKKNNIAAYNYQLTQEIIKIKEKIKEAEEALKNAQKLQEEQQAQVQEQGGADDQIAS